MRVFKPIVLVFVLISLVILGSSYSTSLWGDKGEKLPSYMTISSDSEFTIRQLGVVNSLPKKLLLKTFSITDEQFHNKKVKEFGLSDKQIETRINKLIILKAEHDNKNWIKIRIKLLSWVMFLIVIFMLLKKGKISSKNRNLLYLFSVLLFGVILGSEPSPMGTIKDTIVLLGTKGIIFKPRIIVFSVMIIISIIANKLVCSWACQFGVLQDLLFRMGQDGENKLQSYQLKVPFIVTNSIRVISFVFFVLLAFGWSYDLFHVVEPFKVFNPAVLSLTALITVIILLILSVFIYRPWCHLFCPFGLFSWLTEKVSFFNIKVDYDKCISCKKCVVACPSYAMDSILDKKKFTPDCFSCASCVEVCPKKAVQFKK